MTAQLLIEIYINIPETQQHVVIVFPSYIIEYCNCLTFNFDFEND
jgi:hypothetical protein